MIFQVSSYQIIKIDHCFVSSFSFWSFYEEQYCSIGSEEEDDEEDLLSKKRKMMRKMKVMIFLMMMKEGLCKNCNIVVCCIEYNKDGSL